MSRSDVHSGPDDTVEVVFVTAPDGEVALLLARALVEERLAACVNVVPQVRSVYRWEGAVEEDEETLLVAKTTARRVADLTARVRELHPYDLPETLALPASGAGGSDAYLDWVRAETTT